MEFNLFKIYIMDWGFNGFEICNISKDRLYGSFNRSLLAFWQADNHVYLGVLYFNFWLHKN